MARSHRGFSQVRSQRRVTTWEEGPGSQTVTNLSSSSVGFVGSTIIPLDEGLTIVRIRGRIMAYLMTITAAGDGFSGAFGIGIATTAAVATGIASVPTPVTEMSDDNWLYWTPFQMFGQSAGLSVGPSEVINLEVDTKAMRKFFSGMQLYAAIEVVEEGTAVGELWFDSRLLVKLS